ncbi:CUB and sushi domain-containing protein 1 [Trichonephila clavata]|uniref:CUB and sushi domain-containing protein 1 n=2 Tax=Trichonephila clavata TaxID=2740835 RepID=A0A8X6L5G7_TRICU|nr:CUB and sushi domain-containing protein 1 [Trichonephila clavata]
MSPNRIWHILLSSLILFLSTGSVLSESQCGGYITNPKGYIHTPYFPKPYKVPIHCQWIFEAPQGSKVSVYFTQFYMKKGITAADYTYYSSHIKAGVGKYDFGIISSNDEPTYLVSNQQILVLTMNVRSLDNIHLRVRENLLDVSGFNITYEMILRNETVREDSCIYHHCSFTGNCFATADFSSYICKCFANYFGEECQYDDTCGPNSTSSVCLNGGTCR